MTTTHSPILDAVRDIVGRRHTITRREMRALLAALSDRHLVDLENGWCAPQRGDYAGGWADACRDLTVVSILADDDAPIARHTSSNPGSIRYDEPGSMHPLMAATLMFAPAALADIEYDQIGQLRPRAKRLLVVRDDAAPE